ncbi:MAG: hypothetical protein U9R25_01945 [Chloroflexota bacterium]|nr:hypothetical protein [Chloroflexota bacterium]
MALMQLRDLISDIHVLDREIQRFEERYNLLSEDFYKLYEAGRLRDETIEEIDDYGRWAAPYRMRLRRKDQYDQAKRSTIQALSPREAVVLEPNPAGDTRGSRNRR